MKRRTRCTRNVGKARKLCRGKKGEALRRCMKKKMCKKYAQTGTRKSIEHDRRVRAKPPGVRTSKPGHKYYDRRTGKVKRSRGGRRYVETRRNRSDVKTKRGWI